LPRDRTGDLVNSGECTPGEVVFTAPYVEQIDGRSYGYEDELARIRQLWAQHWQTVYHMLVDLRGFPSAEIRALNPANAPLDPNRGRQQTGPRLVEFSGPDYREDDGGPGGWVCRGNGASGPDCISLVQYLSGGCDRRVAADYLGRLVDRIAIVELR
jgi:hypothetical protein